MGLLDGYKKNHPKVKLTVDEDKDREGEFYAALEEGWKHDEGKMLRRTGSPCS